MKSLLPLAILAALAVAALCYESHESMESYEVSPFTNRRNANTFISPQQRWHAKAQERYVLELDGGSHSSQGRSLDLDRVWKTVHHYFYVLDSKNLKSNTERNGTLRNDFALGLERR
ncbi:matrix Gla protein, isoform CRA_c, partial [Rattus norvegicus]